MYIVAFFLIFSWVSFAQVTLTPFSPEQIKAFHEALKSGKNTSRSSVIVPSGEIGKAALIRIPNINGAGERVYLSVKKSGMYGLTGILWEGYDWPIGSSNWHVDEGYVGSIIAYDTEKTLDAFPTLPLFAAVSVWENNGLWSGNRYLQTQLGKHEPAFKIPAVYEGFSEKGEYRLYMSGKPDPSMTIVVGRYGFATRVEMAPDGQTYVFFNNRDIVPPGPATITFCKEGTCETVFFERRVPVPYVPDGGKG